MKREMRKRVAEENMMMAANKKRLNVQDDVTTNMKNDKDINNNKISYSTMIR